MTVTRRRDDAAQLAHQRLEALHKTEWTVIDRINTTAGVVLARDGAVLGGVAVERDGDEWLAFMEPWPDMSDEAWNRARDGGCRASTRLAALEGLAALVAPRKGRRMTPDEFRALREGLGLTQRRIAEWLGVHEVTVRRWQTGRDPIPYRVPGEIARALMDLSDAAAAEARKLTENFSPGLDSPRM